MWNATSTIAELTSAFADIGLVFAMAIAAILAAWAALVGLGYGIRKARAYVTGRKF